MNHSIHQPAVTKTKIFDAINYNNNHVAEQYVFGVVNTLPFNWSYK
ncbi:hypothetical protein [Methylovulum miyakonense]|nr:hypothetical protein [Methylovulum miyakonense]